LLDFIASYGEIAEGVCVMSLSRRSMLEGTGALAASFAISRAARAEGLFSTVPGEWRTFETVISIQIAKPEGKVQAWVPLPAVDQDDWMRSGTSTWTADGADAVVVSEKIYGAKMLHVVWPEGTAAPVAEVTSRFSTRDRAVQLTTADNAKQLTNAERQFHIQGTELIPVDGIVKETADKITAGAKTDFDKARAIYEWAIENTFRNPKTRGCGVGDITYMIKSGDLSGKCADINALYVGLARASGLPARDVYGLRLGPSKFGYKSLGPMTGVVTKAQHCRAEVFLDGYGWVPVDPADVRKVILEEPPGNLGKDDTKVSQARKTLLGAWEGNWLAYNFAHDIALPGSAGPKLPFLMYPQAETAAGRLDPLDPDSVKYAITAREITAG
jgi:transglutaminase-like putative cysteine protease